MMQKEVFNIKTEADFQHLMEKVDMELKQRGLLIFQRPIHAWKNISYRFGLRLRLTPRRKKPVEGCYTGDDLTIRIFNWYEQKFGERLKVDPNWKMPLIIRGDLFQLNLPTIYGTVHIVFSPEAPTSNEQPKIGIDKPPQVEIFSLIDEITPIFISSLSIDEIKFIMKQCQFGVQARIEIERHENILLVKQAINDIFASTSHLFSNPPNYGLSKWSSLQAAEKMFKSFIELKGQKFKFTHDLKSLASQAESIGLPHIDHVLLNDVQCNAEIRYGNPQVSLFEAVQANYSAIEISAAIAFEINKIILKAK